VAGAMALQLSGALDAMRYMIEDFARKARNAACGWLATFLVNYLSLTLATFSKRK